MESLEVKALRKLPQLRGKDLQDIVEICDADSRLAAVCYKSMQSLQALAEITEDDELSDFLTLRRDLRDSELRDFIKAISEGFMWDYALNIGKPGRALMIPKRKAISEGYGNHVFAKINGTLPARGSHGVVIQAIAAHEFMEGVRDQPDDGYFVAAWNPEDDYVTTEKFKREVVKICISTMYAYLYITFQDFDADRVQITHGDGNVTNHDVSEHEVTLDDCVGYFMESPNLNLFADKDELTQRISVTLTNSDSLEFILIIHPVEF